MLNELTELAAETRFEDLPEAAVQAAQIFLLDCLAVAAAGRRSPHREAVAQAVRSWGAGEAARVLGDDLRLPAASAAFLNAYQMHCLEFDCVHEPAVVHAMTAVAGAALAECEQAAPVDGRRFIAALILGVEVASVLGLAAAAPLSFFRPATAGVFGAAVAVGALRGFDAPRQRLCFGHALSHAAGTMQAHEEGKPTLPLQLANAARGGLVAADLAAAGMPAPAEALEGPYGYFSLFERRTDSRGLAEALGRPWRVAELSHKPFPSGRASHGGISALLQLRKEGLTPGNLLNAELAAPPLIHQLVVRPAKTNMDLNYARLCFPYLGALALTCGAVNLEHFEDRLLNDPDILKLARRFSASPNDASDPAAFTPQTLTARLRDGSRMFCQVDRLPGSPRLPLSERERCAKVQDCLAWVHLDAHRAADLIEAAAGLPDAADARCLLDPVAKDRAKA